MNVTTKSYHYSLRIWINYTRLHSFFSISLLLSSIVLDWMPFRYYNIIKPELSVQYIVYNVLNTPSKSPTFDILSTLPPPLAPVPCHSVIYAPLFQLCFVTYSIRFYFDCISVCIMCLVAVIHLNNIE